MCVFVPVGMGKWYLGVVRAYNAREGTHRIDYRDGESHEHDLKHEAVLWPNPLESSSPRSAAKANHAGGAAAVSQEGPTAGAGKEGSQLLPQLQPQQGTRPSAGSAARPVLVPIPLAGLSQTSSNVEQTPPACSAPHAHGSDAPQVAPATAGCKPAVAAAPQLQQGVLGKRAAAGQLPEDGSSGVSASSPAAGLHGRMGGHEHGAHGGGMAPCGAAATAHAAPVVEEGGGKVRKLSGGARGPRSTVHMPATVATAAAAAAGVCGAGGGGGAGVLCAGSGGGASCGPVGMELAALAVGTRVEVLLKGGRGWLRGKVWDTLISYG